MILCDISVGDVVAQLKRAQKEGRLAEAMLDRRSKLKRYDLHYLMNIWFNTFTVIDSAKP